MRVRLLDCGWGLWLGGGWWGCKDGAVCDGRVSSVVLLLCRSSAQRFHFTLFKILGVSVVYMAGVIIRLESG